MLDTRSSVRQARSDKRRNRLHAIDSRLHPPVTAGSKPEYGGLAVRAAVNASAAAIAPTPEHRSAYDEPKSGRYNLAATARPTKVLIM
jgi:hypothetical protein